MITALGWRPRDVGETEWFDVVNLTKYWSDHPPVHELVAAYMGVKPSARAPAGTHDPSGIGSLVAMFPDGNVPESR